MPTALQGLPDCETRRRLMGWLGLVLVASGLLAAAFASLRLPDQPHPGGELPFGQMVICTGAGLTVIDLDGSGAPLPPVHPADDLCLLCLPLSPAAVALVAAVLLILPPPVAARVPARAPARRLRLPRRLRCFGSTRTTRGPPAA